MKHIENPTAGQGARRSLARREVLPDARGWHRWSDIMPALRLAREALDLNRGRLDLIEKLMACLPADRLAPLDNGELIVHVSNARLAEMMNRVSDKTVTRLITEIEGRGLVRRKSSPNGKRYVRRTHSGVRIAYGIDLGPLLQRMNDILRLAIAAEEQNELCHQARERCSLMTSHLPKSDPLHDEARRILRQRPSVSKLTALEARLSERLAAITPEMCGNDTQNACHKESEHNHLEQREPSRRESTPITPELVERSLPKVANLGRRLCASFRELIDRIVLSLGLRAAQWRQVIEKAGFEEAALLAMVVYEAQERFSNPPAYLWSVVKRSPAGDRPGSRLLTKLVYGSGHLYRAT